MSRIRCSYSIKTLGVALAFFLSPPLLGAEVGALPFDHRRLLLVQMDKTSIPEPKLLAQILDEMRIRGRYQWVLASRPGDPLAPVIVPRDFSWDSPPSVQKMAEKYGVDGVLWIQQRSQEILLKWYDGKEGLPLVFDSTFLRSDGKDGDSKRITTWIETVWSKFPGVGFVAKRDSKFLYFEGALENHLKSGDQVELVRVESVTRHKLFKTLADFRTSPVGKARVVSVDRVLAKAEVTDESSLDPVRMGDRYRVLATAEVVVNAAEPVPESKPIDAPEFVPTTNGLGAVGFSLGYGKTRHTENTVDGVNPTLARNAPALEVNAMGYLTSQWLGWVDYRYRFSTFTNPANPPYTQGNINARVTSMSALVGYRFFMSGLVDEEGHNAMTKVDEGFWLAPFVGYRSYSLVVSDQNQFYGPSSKKLNSFALGFQLRFPFNEKWHMRLIGSKSMFVAYSEKEETSGGNANPSATEISGHLYANVSDNGALGAGFRYQNIGVRYDGAGSRGSATSATSANLKISELTLNYETRF